MSKEIQIIEVFLSQVEKIVRDRWRENMKYEPYARAGDYYPECFAEVLRDMQKAEDKAEEEAIELEWIRL